MKNTNTYHVVGVMSGTSLDGLDLAYCKFQKESNHWDFTLLDSKTIEYTKEIKEKLKASINMSGLDLVQLDLDLGAYFATCINSFKKNYHIDFVSSHGHTVFHQPNQQITLQIGNGIALNECTALPVIYDFRLQDVLRGGQGAPLVPIADKYLFGTYAYCLNLGGIANISFDDNQNRIAFDIAPCNLLLNHLAKKANRDYDNNGELAEKGMVIADLLDKWNALEYFMLNYPKSMGYELVRDFYLEDLNSQDYNLNDLLATCVEHMAFQIARVVTGKASNTLLVTGGGAKNDFLIKRINSHLDKNIVLRIPETEIVDFKEAIAFAFLGVLKYRNEINVLSSVTGASQDSSSGVMIGF